MKYLNASVALAFCLVTADLAMAANACQFALMNDKEIFQFNQSFAIRQAAEKIQQIINERSAIEVSNVADMNQAFNMHSWSKFSRLELNGEGSDTRWKLNSWSLQDGRMYWITAGRSQSDVAIRVKLRVLPQNAGTTSSLSRKSRLKPEPPRLGVFNMSTGSESEPTIWLSETEVASLWFGY